jgi:tetratricopeptide (TPR) repeat protein
LRTTRHLKSSGHQVIRSSSHQVIDRRTLLLLLLLVLALGLWAGPMLRGLWLHRQSIQSLAAYVESHPSAADAAVVLARRYLDARQPGPAEAVLQRLIEQEPETAHAWLLRSEAEFAQNKLAAAYASLQVAMPFLDRSAEAHWRLGLLLERRGDEARAEAEFRRAVQLNPEHAGARLELARAALAERHFGVALQHLQLVIQREPANTAALEALSLAHRGLGDLDQAERHARDAARLAPASAGAWRALGQVLKDRATPAALREGERVLRRALELAPESSELHEQLGLLLFSQDDYKQAATELQRAIDLQPLNRLPYPTLMQCYTRLGQRARADRLRAQYRKLDEMDLATAPLEYSVWAMPENTTLRMRLARLYQRYQRPDLALAQVERVLELNPNHADASRLRGQLQARGR